MFFNEAKILGDYSRALENFRSISYIALLVFCKSVKIHVYTLIFGTRKAEAISSLVMKITANENDRNDILQTFR